MMLQSDTFVPKSRITLQHYQWTVSVSEIKTVFREWKGRPKKLFMGLNFKQGKVLIREAIWKKDCKISDIVKGYKFAAIEVMS